MFILLKPLTVANPIYNITPFTLLDYPDITACILWFAGCNMRCLYCYNPDIVEGKGKYSYEDAIRFIRTRKQLLDGVVLSGGECTLHKQLSTFCKQLKEEGMMIKIDTNGTNPDVIYDLHTAGLVDYIALDYKAPASKSAFITQSLLYPKFETSLRILLKSNIPFEIRTTIHTDLLNEEDLQEMIFFLEKEGFRGKLFIQYFVNDARTIGQLPNIVSRIDPTKVTSSVIETVFRN